MEKELFNMEKELFRVVKEQYEEFEKDAGKVKKGDKRNILIGMLLGIIAADRVYDFNLNEGFVERGILEIEKMM